MLLFVITLLGVSSIRMTHLEEKMSSNLQDKEHSFNAAESALMIGESWVLSQGQFPNVQTTCSAYPCIQEYFENVNLATQSQDWWESHSAFYTTTLTHIATPLDTLLSICNLFRIPYAGQFHR